MSRRRLSTSTLNLPTTTAELTTQERLLIAQSVFDIGHDWASVSSILSKHALVKRPKGYFPAQVCQTLYTKMMEEAGLEIPDGKLLKAHVHTALANTHWVARMQELKLLIAAEEEKFKTIVQEIEDIRAGKWDTTTPTRTQQQVVHASVPASEAIHDVQPVSGAPAVISPSAPEQDGVDEDRKTSTPPSIPELPPTLTKLPEEEIQDEVDVLEDEPARAIDEASPAAEEELPEVQEMQKMADNTVESEVEEEPVILTAKEEEEEEEEQEEEEEEADPELNAKTVTPSPAEEAAVETPATAADTPIGTPSADMDVGSPAAPPYGTREGKRKAAAFEYDAERNRKRVREDSEPVPEDEPATPGTPTTPIPRSRRPNSAAANKEKGADSMGPAARKRFQSVINMLHSQISTHRYGDLFHHRIRENDAPDYYEIVQRPIDLRTIKSKIRDGTISNALEFQRDIYLMFANAMMYNGPHAEVYRMAEEMMLESEAQIKTFKQTQGFANRGRS